MSNKKVLKWFENADISHLLVALEVGDYKIRKAVLPLIYDLHPTNLESILLESLNDPVYPVCDTALNLLEEFDITGKYQAKIEKTRSYWEIKLAKEKESLKSGNSDFDPLWKKADSRTAKRKKDFETMQSNMRPPM
ncbi:hypothetical protein K6119_00610 [Paracrocinitomix mangrovi]|uniref:hypothetical protein n=1 Tax=Paracrocinitomix mangrovi TaxID=2862509 RepID=UPI001C8E0301|nr:hypothetical protein [Paracrocinitomix mangrovi]UKN02016.1 hypothetical protein K6119_00610 [Paracrocinitomix mangrovi]